MNWILISDQLPDNGQEVLVAWLPRNLWYTGDVHEAEFKVHDDIGMKLFHTQYNNWQPGEKRGPTHWTPMPEGPK